MGDPGGLEHVVGDQHDGYVGCQTSDEVRSPARPALTRSSPGKYDLFDLIYQVRLLACRPPPRGPTS
jgi:hypothetical protein